MKKNTYELNMGAPRKVACNGMSIVPPSNIVAKVDPSCLPTEAYLSEVRVGKLPWRKKNTVKPPIPSTADFFDADRVKVSLKGGFAVKIHDIKDNEVAFIAVPQSDYEQPFTQWAEYPIDVSLKDHFPIFKGKIDANFVGDLQANFIFGPRVLKVRADYYDIYMFSYKSRFNNQLKLY